MGFKKRKAKAQRADRNRRKREAMDLETLRRLDEVRNRYAERWQSGDAAMFAAEGHYDWMASFLSGAKSILEVGCGDGRSTLALHALGARIVSVDENPKCIEFAIQRLSQSKIPCAGEMRSTTHVLSETTTERTYASPTSSMPSEGVLIVEGDFLDDNDADLTNWLASIGPFDAIACWNIGTHSARYQVAEGQDKYRLLVQNYLFDVSDRLLRPGGMLHVVDRGGLPASDLLEGSRENLLEAFRDQASTSTLQVTLDSIQHRPYTPLARGQGVGMKFINGPGDFEQMAFWSTMARKP